MNKTFGSNDRDPAWQLNDLATDIGERNDVADQMVQTHFREAIFVSRRFRNLVVSAYQACSFLLWDLAKAETNVIRFGRNPKVDNHGSLSI